MKRWIYPFSGLVEQDALKAALLLNAVDPLIGGVLIRGQKGTGKSTAARALSQLLPEIRVLEGCPFNSSPDAPFLAAETEIAGYRPHQPFKTVSRPTPFIELPLNATEDRVAGTLHVEKLLQTGRRQFEPGLLGAANRGILYVDEVNLLDDHLVDLLLDAAASGVNVVERESLSFAHPARFMLIGTMNPEEGELRPQFLDRFGLCLTLDRITDIVARETIVRRRLAFDHDPEQFLREWADADRLVTHQLLSARARIEDVRLPDALLTLVARLTHELNVAGHRADITLIKAARAHAAFLEKPEVDLTDIFTAAKLAVAHRMPSSPLDSPAQLQQTIELVCQRLTSNAPDEHAPEAGDSGGEAAPAGEDLDDMAEKMQVPGNCAAGSVMLSILKKKSPRPSLMPTNA